MSDDEKLTLLKGLIGETELEDSVLLAYLTVAKQKILTRAYPYDTDKDFPTQYDTLQVEIATYLVFKRGAEGQTAHSENGVNRTYENADVPETARHNGGGLERRTRAARTTCAM